MFEMRRVCGIKINGGVIKKMRWDDVKNMYFRELPTMIHAFNILLEYEPGLRTCPQRFAPKTFLGCV